MKIHRKFWHFDSFLAPVEIGNIVTFTGEIVYTVDSLIQVSIAANVLTPGKKEATTNIFHFTFSTSTPLDKNVFPFSYEESMRYVDGRRKVLKLKKKDM